MRTEKEIREKINEFEIKLNNCDDKNYRDIIKAKIYSLLWVLSELF